MISHNWSPMKRLIWLRGSGITGGAGTWSTISGNPVSFSAKAAPLRQLEVAFSPVQDLHGYDSPWPAGGGKNKLPKCVAGTYTSGSCTVVVADDGTMTLSGTSGDTSTNINIPLVEAVYTPTEDFYLHFLNSNAMGSASLAVENSASQSATSIYGTLTPVNRISSKYTGGNLGAYVNRIRIWIAANTTISGTVHPMICLDNTARAYSPYSNICPILGWDSLNVSMTGINIYDENDTEQGRINLNTGADNPTGNGIRSKTINPIKPNTTYMAIRGNVAGALAICYYDQAGTFLSYAVLSGGSFTTPATAFGFRLNLQTVDPIANPHDISINYPATDTSYHAYNPSSRSISISLGETVYSGYVDVVTGVGEIDKVVVTLKGEMFGSYSPGLSSIYGKVTLFPHAWAERDGGSAIMFSDGDATTRDLMPSKPNAFICGDTSGGNNKFLFIKLDGITTSIADGKAFLDERYNGGNPVTVCYELAEPIPIQLTPQEVESLAGDNTLWSDANQPLTVTYRSN